MPIESAALSATQLDFAARKPFFQSYINADWLDTIRERDARIEVATKHLTAIVNQSCADPRMAAFSALAALTSGVPE